MIERSDYTTFLIANNRRMQDWPEWKRTAGVRGNWRPFNPVDAAKRTDTDSTGPDSTE